MPASIPTKKHSKPIILEAGWAPGPVRPGAKDLLFPNGIRFPDFSARSELLNRLGYPAPGHLFIFDLMFGCKNLNRSRNNVLEERASCAAARRKVLDFSKDYR